MNVVRLYPKQYKISVNGHTQVLSFLQYQLCEYIFLRTTNGRAVNREALRRYMYGIYMESTTGAVSTLLSRARSLFPDGAFPVVSEHNFGYRTVGNPGVYLHMKGN